MSSESRLSQKSLPMVRPKTRGDCQNTCRPCPWVGCEYHLAINVDPFTGKIHFPYGEDFDINELKHTCALDVADSGDHTLDELAEILDVTEQRVRQLEQTSLEKLERSKKLRSLAEESDNFVPAEPRALPEPSNIPRGGRKYTFEMIRLIKTSPLSANKLSKELGVDRSYICKIRKGESWSQVTTA